MSALFGRDAGLRPLIAVTTSELRPSHPVTATPEGEPPQTEMALGLKYLKAIERAGGIPVVVPPLAVDAVAPLLARVSGVCLSGGPDLDPVAYGRVRHAQIGPTWRELDVFELALARAADAAGLPILAICRGLQVLNVARGGTLHQHVPDEYGGRITHRQTEPGERPTHWISLAPESRLARVVRCRRMMVNSFHHQAVDTLGERLRITGRAPDGAVEALEAVDRDFVVGVQWHAECLIARPRQHALFSAFVGASARWEQAAFRSRGAA